MTIPPVQISLLHIKLNMHCSYQKFIRPGMQIMERFGDLNFSDSALVELHWLCQWQIRVDWSSKNI